MFERYTEEARRIIFFARYEASESASPEITTNHLLLGLLREAAPSIQPYLRAGSSVEELRRELVAATPPVSRVSTSVDLPLSFAGKKVLAYASEEAERLKHRSIGAIHLLLGFLQDPVTSALLSAHGVRCKDVLEFAVNVTGSEADSVDRQVARIERLLHNLIAQAQPQREPPEGERGEASLRHTRSLQTGEATITDAVISDAEGRTVGYAVTIEAFGQQRSWQTTFTRDIRPSVAEDP